jgi:hypothetical protein
MSTRDEILAQALALPPEDRAFMSDALKQSLSHDDFATNEIAAARCREIERRLATHKVGDEAALEHPKAYEYLRQTLDEMPAELCHAVVDMLGDRLSPEELNAAWSRELERRYEEFKRGEADALDADESIEELRRSLAARRSEKARP